MKKTLIIILGVATVLLLSGTVVGYAMMNKEVTVTFSDKDKTVETNVFNGTLEQAMTEEGYDIQELKKQYKPSIPWDQPIREDARINLACNCTVSLKVGGKEPEKMKTLQPTVGKFLKEQKVEVDKNDEMNATLDQKIENGMTIVVDKIEKRVQKKVQLTDFPVEKKEDPDIPKGEKKVEREGKKGKVIYQVTALYKNGKTMVTDQKKIDEIKPVAQIVKVGSGEAVEASAKEDTQLSSGSRIAGLKYKKTMQAEATGYTHTGNKTATGTTPHRGTVAVDPDVIPLGTEMYIPGYGRGVAEDTGGAVNGNIIDLFFESEEEAIQWGRRNVTVYILE
ncbi:3D (Asp-Asp-Asp) domain-containing protein [Melghirimyces profundicolus]|uniref:3D (Asp-Asp-Asp) domain-containing protein n=1 Tax=Melghirimyces profundicolus TaxID=1242148 RepID=A0A2T6C9N4_9BACL|nr:3D domain-containing protein [Melghirimyces profundicolus]PTX65039.1 3D (Asp-Asp-Asp) domain-containing protein [Melghirimyces profundicolus]